MFSLLRRLAHLVKSRKTCHGNCLRCPYYADCCADLNSKETNRTENKRLYERSTS